MKRVFQIACLAILTCWVVVSYAALVTTWQDGRLFVGQSGSNIRVGDFVPFYMGSLMARDSLSHKFDIYDPAVQLAYTSKILAPVQIQRPRCLQSPPYLIALLLPLSIFDMRTAWVIWTLAALCAAASAIWYLSKIAFSSILSRILMVASFFAFYPAWLAIGQGQTAPFIFAGLVLFFHLLSKQRFLASGLAAGIISIKLQFLPIPAVLGSLLGNRRFIGGAVIAAVVLAILSVLVFGPQNVINYPHSLLSAETDSRFEGVSPTTMQNVRGCLAAITGGDTTWIHIVSAAAMLLAIVWLAWLWNERAKSFLAVPLGQQQAFDLLVAVSVPIMLTTSVHAHPYDYIYMALPGALLWRHSKNRRDGERTLLFVWMIAFVPLSWLFSIFHDALLRFYVQPYVIWSLIPLAIALRALNRFPKADTAATAASIH